MPGPVDLHIHSCNSSDGDFTPLSSWCALPESRDFAAISISDHDTTAAYPETLRHGEKMGVEIIPSVELTTLFDKREFHLLLPFIDWTSKVLGDLVARVAEGRILEAKARVAKLQELGFDLHGKRSGRHPLLFLPSVSLSLKSCWRREKRLRILLWSNTLHLRTLCPLPMPSIKIFLPRESLPLCPGRISSLLEVLKIVPETGGVPVLAHPGAPFQQVTRADLSLLREHGLEGLGGVYDLP